MKSIATTTDVELPTNEPSAPDGDPASTMMPTRTGRASLRHLARLHTVLCLLGALVSVELTRIHLFVHTDPSYHSVCAVSEGLNCETVAGSPYSVALGLPVSVWGLMAYLVMGLLSLWAASKRRLHDTWPWGIQWILATSCVAVSGILATIAATQISSFCLFCMASYLINLFLLAVCVIAVRRSGASVATLIRLDLKSLLGRRLLCSSLVLGGLTLVGSVEALVPAYWSSSAWSTLPKLDTGTDESGHHWLGGCKPLLTIVEFSDYECPHCRAAHKQMRELAAKYKDEIRLVHRHFPLDMQCNQGLTRPFHEHACAFAEAAECAALQGHFWEMNDALFSTQETAKAINVSPVELAVRIGLNRTEFKRCLESHLTSPKISTDIKAAREKNLEGTPTFLIGEHLYVGGVPESELVSLLRNRSANQSSLPKFPEGPKEFCDGSKQTGGIGSASP